LIYRNKHKQEDGSILYNAGGLLIEHFLIPFLKMYSTVIFLSASLNSSIDVLLKFDKNLMAGLPDIFDGLIPLITYVKLANLDHTIPHTISRVRMFVPCPFREHNMSKVFSVFNLSVWLSQALVFILTSAAFWFRERNTLRSVKATLRRNFHSSRLPQRLVHFIGCFSSENAYQIDRETFISPLRVLLFSTVTVFQAFFASYLVEPGYGKAITTVDEKALDKDFLYGNNP
jgi:hypothetical protein